MNGTAMRHGAIIVTGVAALTVAAASPTGAAPAKPPVVQVSSYDASSLADYHSMWSNTFGPLDNASVSYSARGIRITDVPFKTGVDFSVFDHLKYIAVSNATFPVPDGGSLTFAVDITASTPGAADGHVVHGQYGPPGSYDPDNTAAVPYTASTLQGQQAGVVLNMIDFCSGQLFDWFVSSTEAFPLIERLPSTVSGNTTSPNCPDAEVVGPDQMYTQIIKVLHFAAGRTHRVAITYDQAQNSVEYALDSAVVATVHNVGIPLDKQPGATFSGTYPSLGDGESLDGRIHSFSIGHGLFSLLDAFPFQYGCDVTGCTDPVTAPYSVSIPPSERAFGQGADGTFDHFTVISVNPRR